MCIILSSKQVNGCSNKQLLIVFSAFKPALTKS
jgi:hypothetical protein